MLTAGCENMFVLVGSDEVKVIGVVDKGMEIGVQPVMRGFVEFGVSS